MNSMRSSYLKEMGISEWVPRESAPVESLSAEPLPISSLPVALEADPSIFWHFVGQTPQGDSAMLFENIIRSLRLKKNQWAWATLAELKNNPIDTQANPQSSLLSVVLAFGQQAAQTLSGEKDGIGQLRETVLAVNPLFLKNAEDEIPLIASFDLEHYLAKPHEKSGLWQDLLMARSVLSTI